MSYKVQGCAGGAECPAPAGLLTFSKEKPLLSTELSTFLLIFSLFVLALSALALRMLVLLRRSCLDLSERAYASAVEALKTVQTENADSIGLRRLTELETSLTELTDSYEAVRTSLRKLRARITMRENRERPGNDGLPDPRDDPDGYKRAMRLKLRESGALK